ncbi:hypothetical protein GCM10018980_72350 [Streptomyces capoamus]|uniref:Uncharacterized protein n=1 Tax=Streptomyces capoamus TaxID=68183 RepID=A0A919F371_9ACTN|nr:hypothetical protein GCM10010501_16990 [Streptomyces libani subsp. rufus]GHG75064.1 hypothetical protein GCM10018980_72350 [Streptomyces capoamus]
MTSSDSGAWQLATFHVETDVDVHADHWEMHPQAEEAVCCLTGGVRFYFRPTGPDDTDDMVKLQPGTAVIILHGLNNPPASNRSPWRRGLLSRPGHRRIVPPGGLLFASDYHRGAIRHRGTAWAATGSANALPTSSPSPTRKPPATA